MKPVSHQHCPRYVYRVDQSEEQVDQREEQAFLDYTTLGRVCSQQPDAELSKDPFTSMQDALARAEPLTTDCSG